MTRFLAAPLFVLSVVVARAVLVVVPNTNSEKEGDTRTANPFGWDLQMARIQQVYAASEFAVLGANGGTITGINFRLNSFSLTPSTSINYPLLIKLSTTSKQVDALDGTFAQNIGADETTVFSGRFIFNTAAGPGVLEPFGMIIPLSTPFPYNPTNGSLLVDITVGLTDEYYSGLAIMDAQTVLGDGISAVNAWNGVNDTTPITNGTPTTEGLVTQFNISPNGPTLARLTINSATSSNVVISGHQGVPGGVYSVVSTTNAALPLGSWKSIFDGGFDTNGGFTFTNLTGTTGCRFYRILIH